MFHKVKSVHPLPDMLLRVEFADGIFKLYDVKPLMNKWDVFNDLKNEALFNLVHVDAGGYGIVWNAYIDLSSEELWERGTTIKGIA